ncbi:iron-containing alcohol dehydrogenase [Paraperlucidibaca wandonensis]|jgi:NADP-dependent alcohol dehydrogenase|uniref:Iron-containing alcohol dehydrogenase n=1 Tax=Paraperlucidibaca wandonensis TaxID=1268273 RepID=A0ABW3HHF9_9GAMM|nr:iron-containing alcohol dehydrogenase [Paraperlucidibaca sp.]MBQ0843061.1 iron-containing alcohol dehydrogenase [Paraperlucidibaca sp.]|tara:strand:+ start:3692 stop:4849 length:1158 start_codon:yes stop_codon:yes gene_type:complete
MLNFSYRNPVKVLFGAGMIAQMSKEVPANARVLVTYGGGSVKTTGTLDEVKAALGDRHIIEFGGIEPNPSFETLMQAVELGRSEQADYIVAVGGGSVMDGSKFIAAAIHHDGETMDILTSRGRSVKQALPLGVVVTLAATGSETNNGAVVTIRATHSKMAFSSPLLFPQFAVMDPSKTLTLPKRQVGNGVVDAFVHVVEQYLTYPVDGKIQDRFAEGILLTLIEDGPRAFSEPDNVDVRANLMWAASQALNGLIGAGVPQDWSTHMIGHELTALHGLDHAQTLAVVLPAMLDIQREAKQDKLVQYAERIWGINFGTPNERISAAIERTREFFERLGVGTTLSAYGLGEQHIDTIIEQLKAHGMVKLGERQTITPEVSRKVLEAAL